MTPELAYAAALAADARLIAKHTGTKMGKLPVWVGGQALIADRNAELVYAAIGEGHHSQAAMMQALSISKPAVFDAIKRLFREERIVAVRAGRGMRYEIVT
jgi:hypothetical protein